MYICLGIDWIVYIIITSVALYSIGVSGVAIYVMFISSHCKED